LRGAAFCIRIFHTFIGTLAACIFFTGIDAHFNRYFNRNKALVPPALSAFFVHAVAVDRTVLRTFAAAFAGVNYNLNETFFIPTYLAFW
jgi:hypothetical protein